MHPNTKEIQSLKRELARRFPQVKKANLLKAAQWLASGGKPGLIYTILDFHRDATDAKVLNAKPPP